MEHKAQFVKIGDDDSHDGWESSFVDDYLPEEDEEKQTNQGKENNEDKKDEDWEMSLLGVYVVEVADE